MISMETGCRQITAINSILPDVSSVNPASGLEHEEIHAEATDDNHEIPTVVNPLQDRVTFNDH